MNIFKVDLLTICMCSLCCAESHSAQHTEHTHHHGLDITCCHTTAVHNDVPLPTTFINVTLARLKFKLPGDSRRPKHVGTVLI